MNLKYDDKSESSDLVSALSNLNQSEKDILYMYYIYGRTIKDISKLFDISEAAVYKRIQRAKSHLKEILEVDYSGQV